MDEPLDCAVVGAGPAGLTAALYLSRFRRPIAVFDAGRSRARWIPASHNCPGFPSGVGGEEFLARLAAQARACGARIESGEVSAIVRLPAEAHGGFVVDCGGARLTARTVVLATGCEDVLPRMAGLHDAVARAALRFCPICDAYEAIDRDIAVHGPLADAVSHAEFLRTYSSRVTVVPADRAPDETLRARMLRGGIAFTAASDVVHFDGERCVFSIDGRERPFGVVYALLGSRQRSKLALALGAACDDEGALRVDDHQRTSVPGVYAIGDVVSALNQIAVATDHAAIAATAVYNALPPRPVEATRLRVR
ncbi:MAG TPA: NAD(P)/FAD-dependent oxidoreductase [Zeimonas sp.]|nr:NAD(P)/FAD-dependent oxidoreductase [Zeimonas sp.]